jgi:hypothetical protein
VWWRGDGSGGGGIAGAETGGKVEVEAVGATKKVC